MPYNYGGCNKAELDGLFPEGECEFFIMEISEESSSNGDPVVLIRLEPTDRAMKQFGRVCHRINMDNEWTRINVGRFLAAVGEDPAVRRNIDFRQYKGEVLTAQIKHRDYNGKTYANVNLVPKSEDVARESPSQNNQRREDASSQRSSPALQGARDRVQGRDREPPQMPQDDFRPSGDDIPF